MSGNWHSHVQHKKIYRIGIKKKNNNKNKNKENRNFLSVFLCFLPSSLDDCETVFQIIFNAYVLEVFHFLYKACFKGRLDHVKISMQFWDRKM